MDFTGLFDKRKPHFTEPGVLLRAVERQKSAAHVHGTFTKAHS